MFLIYFNFLFFLFFNFTFCSDFLTEIIKENDFKEIELYNKNKFKFNFNGKDIETDDFQNYKSSKSAIDIKDPIDNDIINLKDKYYIFKENLINHDKNKDFINFSNFLENIYKFEIINWIGEGGIFKNNKETSLQYNIKKDHEKKNFIYNLIYDSIMFYYKYLNEKKYLDKDLIFNLNEDFFKIYIFYYYIKKIFEKSNKIDSLKKIFEKNNKKILKEDFNNILNDLKNIYFNYKDKDKGEDKIFKLFNNDFLNEDINKFIKIGFYFYIKIEKKLEIDESIIKKETILEEVQKKIEIKKNNENKNIKFDYNEINNKELNQELIKIKNSLDNYKKDLISRFKNKDFRLDDLKDIKNNLININNNLINTQFSDKLKIMQNEISDNDDLDKNIKEIIDNLDKSILSLDKNEDWVDEEKKIKKNNEIKNNINLDFLDSLFKNKINELNNFIEVINSIEDENKNFMKSNLKFSNSYAIENNEDFLYNLENLKKDQMMSLYNLIKELNLFLNIIDDFTKNLVSISNLT